MTEITRQQMIDWADEADVSAETAQKLFTLAGVSIKPEVDLMTKLVRKMGATFGVSSQAWLDGAMDRSAYAMQLREWIDHIRQYERQRIIGDNAGLLAVWLNPSSTITLSLRGILSRLAGAE